MGGVIGLEFGVSSLVLRACGFAPPSVLEITPKSKLQIPNSSTLPATIERPEIQELGPGAGGDSWIVTVFDNAKNTWQEVIAILIAATGCTFDEAYMETWEIDHLGKSVVHHGEEDECARVAKTIAEIGIRVEISSE